MNHKEAVALLKSEGFEVQDFCRALGVRYFSFYRSNKEGLSPKIVLALHGLIAINNKAYSAMDKHKDNEAMKAAVNAVVELGNELDKEGEK